MNFTHTYLIPDYISRSMKQVIARPLSHLTEDRLRLGITGRVRIIGRCMMDNDGGNQRQLTRYPIIIMLNGVKFRFY